MLDNSFSPNNSKDFLHPEPIKEDHFPPVDLPLLEALEREFPDRAISPSDPTAKEKFGQITVVRFLRAIYEHQQQQELENVPRVSP
jgi:hypothetical protein